MIPRAASPIATLVPVKGGFLIICSLIFILTQNKKNKISL
jgi:hypothetical protein